MALQNNSLQPKMALRRSQRRLAEAPSKPGQHYQAPAAAPTPAPPPAAGPASGPASGPTSGSTPGPASTPRYDSPQAIYQRYTSARSAWYAAQPRESTRTNLAYRKAMGLPLRYDNKSYEWCRDYKQMAEHCTTSTGSREWTKEEMMAYLDWSEAEDKRVQAVVDAEAGDNPLGIR